MAEGAMFAAGNGRERAQALSKSLRANWHELASYLADLLPDLNVSHFSCVYPALSPAMAAALYPGPLSCLGVEEALMRVAQVTNASWKVHPEGVLSRASGHPDAVSNYYYSDVLVRGQKVSPGRFNGGRRMGSCDWFMNDWASVVREPENDTTLMLEYVLSVPCTCRWLMSLKVFLGQGTPLYPIDLCEFMFAYVWNTTLIDSWSRYTLLRRRLVRAHVYTLLRVSFKICFSMLDLVYYQSYITTIQAR